MVEDQQKELDPWRDVKDMAAREKWAEYWAAWAAQKSLDKEKEKGKKRKYDTEEEAEAAAGDDKDRDPDSYSLKKAAVRICSRNLQERSSR